MDYKNIIFDLGDVILDIDSTKSELSFEKVGISNFKSYFTPQKQISLFEELELGNIEDKESNLNDLQIRNSWNQVLLHFNIERMDFLKELSKRYNIYLFSNTNSIHVECLEKRCLEEMGLPLSSYFDDVWYSNILHLRKPNVEAFETALAHAKTVYNSDTATQEEVDKELEDLMTARGNMKPIVDKTALKEAIDKAEAFKEGKLESDYDNYKNFTDVIVTAKMYYESDRYTQEQLDGVKDRLIAAQEKVTKADASEEKVQLDKLIEQAEALESDMFTEESWTPVETALTEAKAIDDGLKSEYNAAIDW